MAYRSAVCVTRKGRLIVTTMYTCDLGVFTLENGVWLWIILGKHVWHVFVYNIFMCDQQTLFVYAHFIPINSFTYNLYPMIFCCSALYGKRCGICYPSENIRLAVIYCRHNFLQVWIWGSYKCKFAAILWHRHSCVYVYSMTVCKKNHATRNHKHTHINTYKCIYKDKSCAKCSAVKIEAAGRRNRVTYHATYDIRHDTGGKRLDNRRTRRALIRVCALSEAGVWAGRKAQTPKTFFGIKLARMCDSCNCTPLFVVRMEESDCTEVGQRKKLRTVYTWETDMFGIKA